MDQSRDMDAIRRRKDLLPHILDDLAKVIPHAAWAEYPVSTSTYDEGYREFSYGDFANAINGLAWWLHKELGPGKSSDVLAYIGPNDLRYPALVLGALKAGYVMFLTSPRNSVAAQLNLLDRLECKTILSPNPRPAPITAILDAQEYHVLEVPSVDDLLDKQHPHFAYEKRFEEARSEPAWVIHTSGSTGIPKPLVWSHDTAAAQIAMSSQDPPPGLESQDRLYWNKKAFVPFPPFHAVTLVLRLCCGIVFGTIVITPTSGIMPTAQGLVEALHKTSIELAFLVPSIMEELAQNSELLEYCAKNLEVVLYAGGDLPQSVGDVIATKIKVLCQYGASEIGSAPQLLSPNRDPEDWKYVQYHPCLGAEFRHVDGDMHELVVIRDRELEEMQPAFTVFRETHEYASRDLFVRHPSKDKQDLWRWYARADDIIVFLNGEKTNPISMEQHLTSANPDLEGVVVIGAQRFQASLLIEAQTDGKELSATERAALVERIWPSIEEANEDCPAHSRIAKSHILFTHPDMPILRAGKGTVQRAGTLNQYAKEIGALYEDAAAMSAEIDEEAIDSPGDLDDIQAVSRYIKETLSSVSNWPDFDNDDNFFTLGLDSLQGLTAVRKLRRGMAIPTLGMSTIYTNPSVSELTTAVIQLSKQSQDSQTSDEQVRHNARVSMLKEYQDVIDQIPTSPKVNGEKTKEIVILTGSTGSLGSFILHALLANPAVGHVYCLNRVADGLAVQLKRNQTRGLSTQLDPTRVTFQTANLSQKHLGLQPEVYDELLRTTTLIIHNAWPVNFYLSVPSFRPQLDGVNNLIEFTASAATSPHFLFISSISSIMSYRNELLLTPEETVVTDFQGGATGYAESKYISERLLDYAAQSLSIDTSYARVGQIAGAVQSAGLWNKAEWFPSLVISSRHLGAIPDSLGASLGKVDWVPIDLLAEVLVELALGPHQQQHSIENGAIDKHGSSTAAKPEPQQARARVFHPHNPHPTTWDAVRPIIVDELSSHVSAAPATPKPLETVSLDSWLGKIRKDIESVAGPANSPKQDALEEGDLAVLLRQNPAAKLLDFYSEALRAKPGQMNTLETTETQKHSKKLRALEGVKDEWIRKWVREWVASL